jgi:ADP-ribose pyrophosphatase YjhB (NUDIX family)
VVLRLIEEDQRLRHVCSYCQLIHYENPRILVNCAATWENKLLMCQRAHDPGLGLWAPPAGFMEKEETLQQAAARETYEETGVRVNIDTLELFSLTSIPYISEVYVSFRGEIIEPTLNAGSEALDVALFSEQEIPWQQLAFPQLRDYCQLFFREQKTGNYGIHVRQEDSGHRSQIDYSLDNSSRSKG